jgi:protein-glutamine gamma-glutamyltransferase
MKHNFPIHRIAEEPLSRSSINAVAISFLITMIPHFSHLPLWVTTLAVIALLWRSLQSYGYLFQIPRGLLVVMVLGGGISVFAQFWTIAGRDPGLALLTVMTALKFLEASTHRDILILTFLSYFLLATHFLFDQSILIAVFMFACLIIITTTLMTVNQRDDSVDLKTRLLASSRLVALSIPIMIILFILVPRIPGPIWGLTQEQRGGITGLSEDMAPGSISHLITSNEVAFRVSFDGEIPAQDKLYWRGPVMAVFDGRHWTQARTGRINHINAPQDIGQTRYTVTLEPHGKHWIFALDLPLQILPKSFLTTEYQLTSYKPINDLKRYSMSSTLTYRLGLDEDFDYLVLTTSVNEERNPKTIALGRSWARKFDTDMEIIQYALSQFREQNFVYTLNPPMLGENATDEFLFETRRGFCEHYASSFALLMRAAGIPTRIVTGYQGGELNEVGNYLIVRQSDAHAWTEVWLDDRGWVRIDPTAAVSPDRIERGLDQALKGELSPFRFSERNALFSKVLFNWDNLQHRWNEWVLNYDTKKQEKFLRNLGMGIHDWGDMVIALVLCLVVITGGYWLYSWYRERPPKPAVYEIIINQLLKKLAKLNLQRNPAETLDEFLQRIEREYRFSDPELKKIVAAYQRIKYAKGYQKQAVIDRFRKMVSEWNSTIT